MLIRNARRPAPRRGIILMVVIAILAIFAILGVTFVLYSDNEARAARIAREAEDLSRPDMEPELAMALFLNQLLFGARDDAGGVGSGLRGHDLARNLYGASPGGGNYIPFNGTGRLGYQISTLLPPTNPLVTELNQPANLQYDDNHQFVNYTYFTADNFLRDPARLGPRGNLQTAQGMYTGGLNPPYTYPDLNHMYLGALAPSGRVVAKSFHRDWLFNPGLSLNDTSNSNWTNAVGKYLTMRPRPADHAGFPYPDDPTGDVKNLPWAPGGNDSIWIDLGLPVMTAPDGRKFKPLFAPLIVSLDGRVNVNMHGNVLGNGDHRSNQGFGPWEINLGKVLPAQKPVATPPGPPEWRDLLFGNGVVLGKYGANGVPSSNATAATALQSHFYAQIDPDARHENPGTNTPTPKFLLPGFGAPPLQPWAFFPPGYGNGTVAERQDHPILFDVFKPPRYNPANDDRVFAASETDAVLRFGDTGSDALTSDLFRLLPQNLANALQRNLITSVGHLDKTAPGMSPAIYDPTAALYLVPVGPGPDSEAAPAGDAFVFPSFASRTNPLPAGSEFLPEWRGNKLGFFQRPGGGPGQPVIPDRERLDLTPQLPSYPHQTIDPGTGLPLINYGQRWDDTALPPQVQQQYQLAQNARQEFADRIYRRLLRLTGVAPIAPANVVNPSNPELMPRRWLAQLAANLVDYIDEDDISTPFNFYTFRDANNDPTFDPGAISDPVATPPEPQKRELPKYWVFGTELPAVVVNEALVEYDAAAATAPVKVWVELHNPRLSPNPPLDPVLQQSDALNVPLWVPAAAASHSTRLNNPELAYGAYQLEISTTLLPTQFNDNVLGKAQEYPDRTAGGVRSRAFPLVVNFGNPAGTPPPDPVRQQDGMPAPNPAQIPPGGILLAVPKNRAAPFRDPLAPGGDPTMSSVPPTTLVMETTDLEYDRDFPAPPDPTAADAITDERNTGLTVLLRRLANPSMPFDDRASIPDPGGSPAMVPNPAYNPYVTIDHQDKNPLQDAAFITLTARGKRQPYAGFTKLIAIPPPVPPATEPVRNSPLAADSPVADQMPLAVVDGVQHTFGQVNTPGPNIDGFNPNGRYDWLVHLDRWPVSPMELLHVSGFQPHQLTQRFVHTTDLNLPAVPHRHMAPWFEPDRRLYRLFEFLDGMYRLDNSPAHRDAGKIDLNALNSLELPGPPQSSISPVFRALCDAQASNYFTEAQVDAIFTQMIAQRTPDLQNFPEGPARVPGRFDRPFLGTATGPMVTTATAAVVMPPPAPPGPNPPQTIQVASLSGTAGGIRWALFPGTSVIVGSNTPGDARETVQILAVDNSVSPPTFTAVFNQPHPMGTPVAPVGIENTWLRSFAGTNQRLFEVVPQPPVPPNPPPPDHPYLRYELMRKIANNITNRSNTFAVWVTVGFFEVVDDTTLPPRLGAEIGRDQGRHVRHRFFAIVDRSNLRLWETTSPTAVNLMGAPAALLPLDLGTRTGLNTNAFEEGMPLYVDDGPNEEKVILEFQRDMMGNVIPGAYQAWFRKNHAANFRVRAYGNPGPQDHFHPGEHPDIVRYFAVIE